jgi:hypothetical protein
VGGLFFGELWREQKKKIKTESRPGTHTTTPIDTHTYMYSRANTQSVTAHRSFFFFLVVCVSERPRQSSFICVTVVNWCLVCVCVCAADQSPALYIYIHCDIKGTRSEVMCWTRGKMDFPFWNSRAMLFLFNIRNTCTTTGTTATTTNGGYKSCWGIEKERERRTHCDMFQRRKNRTDRLSIFFQNEFRFTR